MAEADLRSDGGDRLLAWLAQALVEECQARQAPHDVRRLAAEALEAAASFQGDLALSAWRHGWRLYARAGGGLAEWLNRGASIARNYATMDEFWADAALQSSGESPFTFWDVYEHGSRRQLETQLAALYSSESSLLLNCGMSALAVAIDHGLASPKPVVVAPRRNYFETTELLDLHAQRGVEIVRIDLQSAESTAALAAVSPDVVLFEPVTNTFDATPARVAPEWVTAAPRALFICDNTVHGPTLRWQSWLGEFAPSARGRFVVAESLAKYICNDAMAGVLYGDSSLIDRLRLRARASGQQLQERAFNVLRRGDIAFARERISLHRRNAALFADALSELDTVIVRPDGAAPPGPGFVEGLLEPGGAGCLVFVQLTGENVSPAAHRSVLRRWHHEVHRLGGELGIRAGFGWPTTSARVYEGTALNQQDAPTYLRISAGLEPASTIRAYAGSLQRIIKEEIALAPVAS